MHEIPRQTEAQQCSHQTGEVILLQMLQERLLPETTPRPQIEVETTKHYLNTIKPCFFGHHAQITSNLKEPVS